MLKTKYRVQVLFRNGPLNGYAAVIETAVEPGEMLVIPYEGDVLNYQMADGPAIRHAMETGKSHPNLAACAIFRYAGELLN